MPTVVGIKHNTGSKVYYFDPKDITFTPGEGAIVETARGQEFGTVVMGNTDMPQSAVTQALKPVIRKATEKDEEQVKKLEEKKPAAMQAANERIRKHKLNMKLVDCEFPLDGSKAIFYFTAETRVDFRELVRDLASHFHQRIELRQIGGSDECKMLGGLGPCGRPCCCSQHLKDYKRVSIKMAKTQGLSLNPGKIGGLCGRLMCCLEYENDHYAKTVKRMPKVGSEVTTPDGRGTVTYNHILKEVVRVRVPVKDTYELREYPLADIVAKVTLADDLDAEDERSEHGHKGKW
ncbi:MAG: stage 0 sporulation family protein [Clostridiales bacterium]|jgi:cell fate regulator YaaT (PSP1 superfamily)|nr:stage 0 sporulation family protein [Clostridiales bacterium]